MQYMQRTYYVLAHENNTNNPPFSWVQAASPLIKKMQPSSCTESNEDPPQRIMT